MVGQSFLKEQRNLDECNGRGLGLQKILPARPDPGVHLSFEPGPFGRVGKNPASDFRAIGLPIFAINRCSPSLSDTRAQGGIVPQYLLCEAIRFEGSRSKLSETL